MFVKNFSTKNKFSTEQILKNIQENCQLIYPTASSKYFITTRPEVRINKLGSIDFMIYYNFFFFYF